MLGVILCGGKSVRMGADKGMLKLHANTWAQIAVDKMAILKVPVVLSVNATQYNDYSRVFPPNQLIKDNEALSLKGPLCGVLSAHLQHPAQDLFVLACDMPLMEPGIIEKLCLIYQQQPASNAFVFTNDGEPEPLCAVYTCKGLSHIAELYKAKLLEKHSMKCVLEQLTTNLTALSEEEKIF